MLFWLFVIVLVVGVACIVLGNLVCDNTKYYNDDWLRFTGIVIVIAAALAILISGIVMIESYGYVDAKIAQNNKRYESLTYQLENNLYDNDNDLGKYDLYNQVREWNEELAKGKANQYNFWYGIFYPNIYDNFDYIKLK